jgi:hypothetical protein
MSEQSKRKGKSTVGSRVFLEEEKIQNVKQPKTLLKNLTKI